MSRLASLIALLAIAIVIGVVFFQVMVIFLVPMFLAVVLVIIFKPLHERFCRWCGGRERIAAALTTITILLIVLIPLAMALTRAAAEGWAMVSKLDQESMSLRIRRLRTTLDLELPPPEVVNALKDIGMRLDLILAEPNPGDEPAALADRQRQLHDLATRRAKVVKEWVEKVGDSEKSQNPGFLSRWSGADGTQLVASTDAMVKQLEELEQMKPDEDEYVPTLNATVLAHRKVERQLLGDDLVYLLRSKANPSEDDLKQLREKLQATLAPAALSAAPVLGKVFFGGLIMIVALYYFLADGAKMISSVMRLSPLDPIYAQQLLDQFVAVSRAVVVATLLTALVQGLLAGIGFWQAGLQAVFLLSVLTMVGAIVPFVGAAAVWIPAAAWLVFEGYIWQGAGLALYGLLIISTSDNLIKPMILHGQSNLHPLLALVSVLGGVVALGPIGVFVGPMAVVFLQVVLQMLNTELKQLGAEQADGDKPAAAAQLTAAGTAATEAANGAGGGDRKKKPKKRP
ncbi:MAG: AI-2E family transporter [Pirellulales bacterium]